MAPAASSLPSFHHFGMRRITPQVAPLLPVLGPVVLPSQLPAQPPAQLTAQRPKDDTAVGAQGQQGQQWGQAGQGGQGGGQEVTVAIAALRAFTSGTHTSTRVLAEPVAAASFQGASYLPSYHGARAAPPTAAPPAEPSYYRGPYGTKRRRHDEDSTPTAPPSPSPLPPTLGLARGRCGNRHS